MNNNITKIVKSGLCTSCGICSAICRPDAIIFKNSAKPFVCIEKCIDCGLCLQVCPGQGLDLIHEASLLYSDAKQNNLCGRYLGGYVGYSNNKEIRFTASSGGLVTQFLLYLLDKNIINGAIVTGFNNESKVPYSFLATTKDEIISSKGSKYVLSPINQGLSELLNAKEGKYVIVGLPCQIQGVRKLIKKRYSLQKKIVGVFSLYCSLNKIQSSVDYYLRHNNVSPDKFESLQFRTEGCLGNMKIVESDSIKYVKYESYWHGTHSFFVNERCSMCNDHFGELADISFGDINIPPYNSDKVGINSLIVRDRYWKQQLLEAVNDEAISLNEINIKDILKSQSYCKFYKKGPGLRATLKIRKTFGYSIPNISMGNEINIPFSFYIKSIIAAIMRFVGRKKYLWLIINMLDKSRWSNRPQ